jgi:hypothetical protein
MESIIPLRMPVALPMWGLATLTVTRLELRGLLGEPHFVETDTRRTCGGERDGWASTLPSGQRVLIILDVTVSVAELFADPPDLDPVLQVIGISANDPRLTRHARPWELR